ncbi:hypothetical protein ATJ97_1945 [Georgenia soli]|uniref:TrbL/VirB6 plasmid conjugal transfer protein n=1 Tax=Georgenia soli TaxID=638953 RepID=A0A2A9EMK3_9MICO|nr:hypothetical protein [Georgenia soli]PFG39439.1 hypothetical protein ATJ97_1945 [Georgenia soli]
MSSADPTTPVPPGGCSPLDVTCATSTWTADDGSSTALDQLAGAVSEALDTTLSSLGKMWENVATPALTGDGEGAVTAGSVAPGSVAAVETVLGWVVWISLGVAVMSLLALGAWLALAGRRGDGGRQLGRVGIVLGGVLLISGASAVVGALVPPERFAGGSAPVATTQNALWWFTAAMAVLSVIVAGAKMAWEQRAAAGRDLVRSLLTLVVVAGAGLTVIGLAVVAADGFAAWLLERVTGGEDFGTRVRDLVVLSDSLGVLLVIVLGLLAVVVAFVQIMLLVLRGAMLVILAGIFPLSAAFTNTAVGRAWFSRVVAWIVAFVLYKPAVAIVYATAFQLTDTGLVTDDGTGLVPLLAGIILMVLALLALPALMSVAAPLVGTVAPGGTPAAAALPPGTSAALPSGAAAVHRVRPAAAPPAPAGAAAGVGLVGPRGSSELRGLRAGDTTVGPGGSGNGPGSGPGSGAPGSGGQGSGAGVPGGATEDDLTGRGTGTDAVVGADAGAGVEPGDLEPAGDTPPGEPPADDQHHPRRGNPDQPRPRAAIHEGDGSRAGNR